MDDPAARPETSKAQRKRDMEALRQLATRLTKLPASQIERLPYPDLRAGIHTARHLTRGNARKRQIQHLSKQLKALDRAPIMAILDRLDASSAAHIKQFRQLEQWREQLLTGDFTALAAICHRYPHTDRQHLRTLTRNAIAERQQEGNQRTHFRKVFKYLKELVEE